MNSIIRILIGAIITACGGLVLINSASMSFQGYEREFSGLHGAGLIGVGIAGLAFFCAGAIGIAVRSGLQDVAFISAIMAAVCFGGDVYGNTLATYGEIENQRETALKSQAALNEATKALALTRSRLETVQSNLQIISGDDICAAQRVMIVSGFYHGKIDCKSGPLTETAMMSFGSALTAELKDLNMSETINSKIVSQGATIAPSQTDGLLAKAIAILLTLLSMAASAIGLPLMVGNRQQSDDLEALEATMDGIEADVIELFEWAKPVLT